MASFAFTLDHSRPAAPPRRVFGPFAVGLIASAVLAALLVKFSTVIAPPYNVELTAWTCALFYLDFILVRAAFVANFAAVRPGQDDEAAQAEAKLAFALSIRGYKRTLAIAFGLAASIAAALDVAFTMKFLPKPPLGDAIVFVAFFTWAAIAPRLIVASGLWAREGTLDAARAFALIAGDRGDVFRGWALLVAAIGVLSTLAYFLLYPGLRAIVVGLVPDSRAVYLFSAAFMAALIGAQLIAQARFGVRTVDRLLGQEQARTRAVGRPIEGPFDPARPRATAPTAAGAVRAMTPSYVRRTRFLAVAMLAAAALPFALQGLNDATAEFVEAKVVSSSPACKVSWREPNGGKGKPRSTVMTCADADAFVAAHADWPKIARGVGSTITFAYNNRNGIDRQATDFAFPEIAKPILAAGHARLQLHLGQDPAASLPYNFAPFRILSAPLGLGGLFLLLLPALRHRVFGTPYADADPADPDESLPEETKATLRRVRRLYVGGLIAAGVAVFFLVLSHPEWILAIKGVAIAFGVASAIGFRILRRKLGAADKGWPRRMFDLKRRG